ncbi:AbrB/MazE/SpoVT family DNA-binding domain-containing protein [uncultured Pseudomonas sp.]|uniref:AbrB/MazE/SpoVT family DNA-binding domain-containing protein n=1 Tax=uncultured Pseudomonas sp. TaxID=114707 RepID=UPI0025D5E615|nr:AbrB/MazE/SpoVT family DNA-binding domain-containing protein [uncultured Pseudomonas sp.]
MKTQIRRVGNSAGVVIPAIMLKEAKVEVGTSIELTVSEGVFIAKPIFEEKKSSARSKINLDMLINSYVRFEDEVFAKPIDREVINDEYPNEAQRE